LRIEPLASNKEAWFRLGNSPQRPEKDYTLDLAELGFLISDMKSSSVLMNVALQERRFKEVLGWIQLRSEVLSRDARPLMAAAGINDMNASDASVRAAIGPFHSGALATLTMGVINGLQRNLREMPTVFWELRDLLCERLPGRYFPAMDFSPWNPPGRSSAPK
jgi:hypothetical protein